MMLRNAEHGRKVALFLNRIFSFISVDALLDLSLTAALNRVEDYAKEIYGFRIDTIPPPTGSQNGYGITYIKFNSEILHRVGPTRTQARYLAALAFIDSEARFNAGNLINHSEPIKKAKLWAS